MNVEHHQAVQRLVEGVNTGDVPRDVLTDDCELRNATTAVTDATYHGYEGGLKWRQDFFDVVEDGHFEAGEVLAEGDDYLVITNSISGRGSSSGAPVDLRWTSVFWFRDGKICRAIGYNRRREALEAVGL
jgi:ketosteroid isomerase-like protein